MTQILQFKSPSTYGAFGTRNKRLEKQPIEFWPESASRSQERPVPVNPANAFGRVLFEMSLVLAGAGALAVVVSLLAPGTGIPQL